MSMTLTHPETIGSLPPPVAAEVQKKPRLRLDFLDGLRALALIWVVLGHFAMNCFGGMTEQHGLLGLATNWLHYLHFGVDIFIVLSGFCLIIPVARSGGLSGGPFTFFKKRARRILPPFYAAMILGIVIDSLVASSIHQHFTIGKKMLFVNAFLLQDICPAKNYINGAFWSIAVEWKIYFLFPFFIYLLHRHGRKAALLAAAGIGYGLLAVASLPLPPHWPKFSMASPWYVLLFTLGACAGSVVFDTARPVAWKHFSKGMLAVSLAASLSLAVTLWLYPVVSLESYLRHLHCLPVADALVGTLMSSLLLWLGSGTGSLRGLCLRLLSWRPLVALGGFSYSVYLLHLPMVALVGTCLWSKVHWSGSVKLLALTCIGGPIILGLSYLFYLVCERPFMNTRPTESKIAALPGSLRFAPAPVSPTNAMAENSSEEAKEASAESVLA